MEETVAVGKKALDDTAKLQADQEKLDAQTAQEKTAATPTQQVQPTLEPTEKSTEASSSALADIAMHSELPQDALSILKKPETTAQPVPAPVKEAQNPTAEETQKKAEAEAKKPDEAQATQEAEEAAEKIEEKKSKGDAQTVEPAIPAAPPLPQASTEKEKSTRVNEALQSSLDDVQKYIYAKLKIEKNAPITLDDIKKLQPYELDYLNKKLNSVLEKVGSAAEEFTDDQKKSISRLDVLFSKISAETIDDQTKALEAQSRKIFAIKKDSDRELAKNIAEKLSPKGEKTSEEEFKEAVKQANEKKETIIKEHPEYSSEKPLNFSLILNNGPESKKQSAMQSAANSLLRQKTSAVIVSQDIIRQLATKPEEGEWIIYQTNGKGTIANQSDLYVLIPKKYAVERFSPETLEHPDELAEKLGLRKQTLVPIAASDIPGEKCANTTAFSSETTEKIKAIISSPSGYDNRARSFTWTGHGMANNSIGGIEIKAAQDLIKHLGNCADSLHLLTCYGAGANLEKIKSTLENFSPEHGKMIMAVQGLPADRVALSATQDFETYFAGMHGYLTGKYSTDPVTGAPLKKLGDMFSYESGFHNWKGPSQMKTEQSVIVRLPGSAKGFEPVAIDNMLAVIGTVKGQKTYDLLQKQITDPEKLKLALEKLNITVKDKNVLIVAPDHVKPKIIIEGSIPNIISGRGGITQKLFENVEIKTSSDKNLDSVLNKMLKSDDTVFFHGTYLIKSLVINGKPYKNVFVKREGAGPDQKPELEIYYQDEKDRLVDKDAKILTEDETLKIKPEVENLKKSCQEEPDTAKTAEETKLKRLKLKELEQEELGLDKLKDIDWSKTSQNLVNKDEFYKYKDHYTQQMARIKAEKALLLLNINPEEYKILIKEELKTINLSGNIDENLQKVIKASRKYRTNVHSSEAENTIAKYKESSLWEIGYEIILKQMGITDLKNPEKYFKVEPKTPVEQETPVE